MTGLLPWLLVALLLSTWLRRTHIIDWQESVTGRVGDVVEVFADIDRYVELMPKGAVSESGFVDRWEDRSPDGARHQIDHFRLKTKLGTIQLEGLVAKQSSHRAEHQASSVAPDLRRCTAMPMTETTNKTPRASA